MGVIRTFIGGEGLLAFVRKGNLSGIGLQRQARDECMMLGFLLARAGVDGGVLEKHKDFLRDFRGDAIHPSTLYVFLDEGGNFDFTAAGTPYFLFSSIAKERPFAAYQDMTELKYDLIETGANIEYFHAAEDVKRPGTGCSILLNAALKEFGLIR